MGGVSGLQLLCLWLGRPESVSDGGSAEQPLSPGGLGVLRPMSSLSNWLGSTGLGKQEGSMGQQLWPTSEQPQKIHSTGCSHPNTAQAFHFNHLSLLATAGRRGRSSERLTSPAPIHISCFGTACCCMQGRAGVAVQHLSRASAGASASLPGELR